MTKAASYLGVLLKGSSQRLLSNLVNHHGPWLTTAFAKTSKQVTTTTKLKKEPGNVVLLVKCLPSMCEVLGLSLSTT